MLEPHDRRHVLDILRPPEHYRLDCAVGTTYSLDLVTLMTVPLAFLGFDWNANEGRPTADPLAILEALRQNADRIHIFCQSGRIAVPQAPQLLMTYLEKIVVPVRAPHPMGVFHAKVWVLRYAPMNDGEPVRYRLLCLSRNLTFDRCWDTSLVLDGVLTDRQNAFAYAHPLGDFVAALPRLALQQPSAGTLTDVERIQNEVRRVDFDPPAPFKTHGFRPLGIENYRHSPFDEPIERALVVSPFLSAGMLETLTQTGLNHVLVSRGESLDEVGRAAVNNFASTYLLSSAVEDEEPDLEAQESSDPWAPLAGLHAKLYVVDTPRDSMVLTGSANATQAAFHHNVEFMVALYGARRLCGVDTFLQRVDKQVRFIDLLEEYRPKKGPAPVDPVRKKLEERLRATQNCIAAVPMRAIAGADEAGSWSLTLEAHKAPQIAAQVDVTCWPISLGSGVARPLAATPQNLATFEALAPESLSPFFAFELTAREGDQRLSIRFVQVTTLVGAPADRQRRILRAMLRDREQVMRYLLMLLSDPADPTAWLTAGEPATKGREDPVHRALANQGPLFEALLLALSRDPARLDAVSNVLNDLHGADAGGGLGLEGLDVIWPPIWEARQRLQQGREAA